MKEREMKITRIINAEIADAMSAKELYEHIHKDMMELVKAHAKSLGQDEDGIPIKELVRVRFEYTPVTSRYEKRKPITGTAVFEAKGGGASIITTKKINL